MSLLIQICESEDVEIIKEVISSEHVHMHINYLYSQFNKLFGKKLKGKISRKLQQEYPAIEKTLLGQYYWAICYGCWSKENITDKVVNVYLEHHGKPDSQDDSNFILA